MFIVIEGLDGAGKSTQVTLLREALKSKGIETEYLHFPRFDAPIFGDMIARFLRGELGKLEDVNPYVVALLYAGDRANASSLISGWINDGKCVIVDRYVYSNIAYQCAKIDNEDEREKLRNWIFTTEYDSYSIIRPDLSLFLDVPFKFTKKKLSEQREGDDRNYLNGAKDIHEESLSLQEKVREVYLNESKRSDSALTVIPCSDEKGDMLSPDAIFTKILSSLKTKFELFR